MKSPVLFGCNGCRLAFLLFALWLVPARPLSATVITWTNASNGNWSVPANWHPNQVPSTNDTAVITNAGTYTVTLNLNPTLAGLIAGGDSGTQTVATAGHTLILNGSGVVNSHGQLLLSGGALSGPGQISVAGLLTWTSGAIDTNAVVTVLGGGRVSLASTASHAKLLYGSLTNGGSITWQPVGNLSLGGVLHNQAEGVFEDQAAYSITKSGSNALFINEGLFRKSTATATLACYVPFINAGTVDTRTGELQLQDGSILNSGSRFTGAGVTLLNAGTNTLNGDVYAENLVFSGGALTGTGRLSGALTWSSGMLHPGAALTMTTNSVLTFSSGGNYDKFVHGSLTNAGTIRWQPMGSLSLGGIFHNLAGGVFEAQVDNIALLSASSDARIINDGVLRKAAGSYTVGCYVPTRNDGTVEIFPGTLRFYAAYTNSGGTIALAGGTFRTAESLFLAGGLLTGWGTLNANVTNAATIRPSRSNGVLTINGTCEQLLGGRMEFELAGNVPGTNQSCLNLAGAATLRGTVGVTWGEGYVPAPGTSFPVLGFASCQGEFCCFDNFLLLGQGRQLTSVYSVTNLTLVTIAAPEPATVPLRVTVDGGALVCWPVEFPGYELYWSTNLTPPDWTLLPGATHRLLEAPPLAREKFFRLHQP